MDFINVMFTGDSIADCGRARPVGVGFGRMGDGYVARIFIDTYVDRPNHNIRYFNSATSGNTSKDLLDRFDSEILAYKPDYLFIMIGVNDVWRHFDGGALSSAPLSTEETVENMRQMILKAKSAGTVPVVLSPYFLEFDPNDKMRRALDEINAGYRALCEEYGLGYIDVQSAFDAYCKTIGSSYPVSADRVHPKALGCALLAKTIYNDPAFRVIFHD